MKDIEIEIQVQVERVKPLKDFLEKEGKFVGEVKQVDNYYTPIHRNFTDKKPIEEWLRLRDTDGKCSITYKKWYYTKEKRSTHADEYETDLGEIEKMESIFRALDVKRIITIKKVRRLYNYQDYEIALDSIEDLGDFVEVEYKGDGEVDPVKVTGEMVGFLKKTGVGKIIRNYVGYPFMLLYPGEGKFEEL